MGGLRGKGLTNAELKLRAAEIANRLQALARTDEIILDSPPGAVCGGIALYLLAVTQALDLPLKAAHDLLDAVHADFIIVAQEHPINDLIRAMVTGDPKELERALRAALTPEKTPEQLQAKAVEVGKRTAEIIAKAAETFGKEKE